MYIDIACNSRTSTDDDVREFLFKSIEYGIKSITVLPIFLPSIKDLVIDGVDLSCFIDYPYGSSDTSVRSHAALTAIRRGANTLDVVLNSGLFFNGKQDKFYDDIETILTLCKEHGVTLRAVLEYRLYDYKDVLIIGNKLREMGIEYIIPSTGSQLDTWDDNLAISIELTEKSGINVITNGVIVAQKHYDVILGSTVFGARFSSLHAMKNIKFGV